MTAEIPSNSSEVKVLEESEYPAWDHFVATCSSAGIWEGMVRRGGG